MHTGERSVFVLVGCVSVGWAVAHEPQDWRFDNWPQAMYDIHKEITVLTVKGFTK